MSNIFNISSDISMEEDIFLHENITIITDYFFNCFKNNIYCKIKNNTNYKIDKNNIRDIFISSVNHYLLESAKEQKRNAKYINTTVSNKPYDPVIDNICCLVRQYTKDKEQNKQNFDKILFKFMDLLLEYCGLRNGDLFKKDNREKYDKDQLDKLINILIQKYVLKYNPEKLKFKTKAKTTKPKIDPTKISNKKRIELLGEEYKFLERMKYHADQRNLFCNENSELFNKIPGIKNNERKLKRTFKQMGDNNSITRKIINKTHTDLKDKIIKTILPIKKALGIITEVVKRATELTTKMAKFIGLSNVLSAEKERTKIKTKTRERTTERSQKPTVEKETTKEQKPTQTKQKPEKSQESQQPPVIDNKQPQPNQDNEQKQEEEQRKLAEQQKQEQLKQQEELRRKQEEQKMREEREAQQRLKEERERFEKQQRELEEQMKNRVKSIENEPDKLEKKNEINGKSDEKPNVGKDSDRRVDSNLYKQEDNYDDTSLNMFEMDDDLFNFGTEDNKNELDKENVKNGENVKKLLNNRNKLDNDKGPRI